MQSEINLAFNSIFQSIEQKGFDIRCNNIPSAKFIRELDDRCKEFFIDVEKTDILYFVFDLYVRYKSKKLAAIDISFGKPYNLFISLSIFWEIISSIDLDVTKLAEFATLYEEDVLLSRLENFIVDYCKYLIVNKTERHYTQLYINLTKIKEVPQHSILCSNISLRYPILFRNIFRKIGICLIEYLGDTNDPDFFNLSQADVQYDLRREIVLLCLSYLQYKYNKYNVFLGDMWDMYSLSPSMTSIVDIYRSLFEDLNDEDITGNDEEQFAHLFSEDNQLIISLLQLCIKLNMEKHLSEDSFLIHHDSHSDLINAYLLARSSKILCIMLSLINSSKITLIPMLQCNLTNDTVEEVIRSILTVNTSVLQSHFSAVLSDELLHINFLIWCLQSKYCIKSIFLWFIDSKLFNVEVEEKFLFHFNDLISYLCEPSLCRKLAQRMCLVNEENFPLNRYIKFFKLFIFEMPNKMKQIVLFDLMQLQSSRTICSPISFEANLRKCCSQLSCDLENSADVCLDLEYLLFINPVIVIVELMKIECFKAGLQESIRNIFAKINYSFTVSLEDEEILLIKAIHSVFFEGNNFKNKALDSKKISEQIYDCLENMFKLIEDNSIADKVFSKLILPHLDVEDMFSCSSHILLRVILSNTKLHNLDFSSKLTALLIKLTYSHRYLSHDINSDSVDVSAVESCIHKVLTDLSLDLDFDFIESRVNNMELCQTKLLFWLLFNNQGLPMTIWINKHKYLSTEILSTHSIVQQVRSIAEYDANVSNEYIINDFGTVLLLCSTSEELLAFVKEATLSIDDWKVLKYNHVLATLIEISRSCTFDCWRRILNYLMFCVDNHFIVWLYKPLSLHCLLDGIKNYRGVLIVLSLIHCLLDLWLITPEHLLLHRLLVTSLSKLIPKSLSEVLSYSDDTFFVQYEILLHYLQIYKTLESNGIFGLKSVLLCALPLLSNMAGYNDDVPEEMKDLLHKLSDYEKLLM